MYGCAFPLLVIAEIVLWFATGNGILVLVSFCLGIVLLSKINNTPPAE